ncbi:MAG: tetratricopeptide repeat protein, partial [Gemmatimonadales bacterium]|nr:tetratricopeptide repeat protein [Gemmatimonadales bacterium]
MLSLRLFGGVSIRVENHFPGSDASQSRRVALLALLATTRTGATRDKLVGYLWPESGAEQGRHLLSESVYQLRKSLGSGALVSEGDNIRLNPDLATSDVAEFEAAVERGDLETAVSVYAGPFLDGFYVRDAPEFERWVETERRRLADSYAMALERFAEEAEAAEDHPGAVERWKRLIVHDAYNSRYVLRSMQAMVAAGDPANAIQQAEEHTSVLESELGLEPPGELLTFSEQIRRKLTHREVKQEDRVTAGNAERLKTEQKPEGGAIAVGGPSGKRGGLKWRKSTVGAALVFALLGVAVTAYSVMRVTGIGPWDTLLARGILEERDLIVLAEFEDHTGDSTLALAMTITEAIRVDLGQSPVVRVTGKDYVASVLRRMERDPDQPLTYELAREVAIRQGLKAVVAGAVNAAGTRFVLSARLVSAESGEEIFSLRKTATHLDSIIPTIDRLSASFRERIGESLETVRSSPPLSQVTTSSLEALRLLTESSRAIEAGDLVAAIDYASRAIEIDTAFAAAYRARSVAVWNFGWEQNRVDSRADATKAYELRHRLTLSERYSVEAFYHSNVTGNLEKAAAAYRALLALNPDDRRAVHNLGNMYWRLGQLDSAEEMYHRRLEMDSTAAIVWAGLVSLQIDRGKYPEAEGTLRLWEERMPEHGLVHSNWASLASVLGDYDAAATHLEKQLELGRGSPGREAELEFRLGQVAQLRGKLTEAERHFSAAMELDGNLICGIEFASTWVWFLGDTARALETLAAALETHPIEAADSAHRDNVTLTLAGFYASAGLPARARAILTQFEESFPEKRGSGWSRTVGAVALAEGRAKEALRALRESEEASPCRFCTLPMQARAFELAGQPDSALATYERYIAKPVPVYNWRGSPTIGSGNYWLPVVYERLGKLYEQRGNTE